MAMKIARGLVFVVTSIVITRACFREFPGILEAALKFSITCSFDNNNKVRVVYLQCAEKLTLFEIV